MSEVGIYHLNEAESSRDCLIKSQLFQGDLIESERDRWFGEESVFEVGNEAESMRQKMENGSRSILDREVFSRFKRDLMHSMGGEHDHMRRFRSEHTDIDTPTHKQGHLQEPRNVATAFVGTILRQLMEDLPSRFDESTLKVFFTRPVGEGRSDKYQGTIKEKVVPALRDGIDQYEVVFPDQNSQYEYEPYGAFQYVLRDSYRFEEAERRPSYLIVDVGGATTDVTFAQAILGNRPSASPVSRSIWRAGNDYDEILLRQVNSRSDKGYESEELEKRIEQVLPRVKRKKEKASRDGAPVSLKVGSQTFEIRGEDMMDAFDIWWEGGVGDTIRKCLSEAKDKSQREKFTHITEFDKIDHAFLVGGASQLRVLNSNLLSAQLSRDFDAIDENAVALPGELEVDSSLLAALGQAVSIRDVDEETGAPKDGIQKASVVEGRFRSSEGEVLRFQREDVEETELIETPLRSKPEDEEAVNLFYKGEIDGDSDGDEDTVIGWDKFGREPTRKLQDGAEYILIEVRSSFSGEWNEVEEIDVRDPEKDFLRHKLTVGNPKIENGSAKYRHISEVGEVSRHENTINDNDVRRITNRKSEHKKVSVPLNKTYEKREGDLFICVDIGMTNSSVAVYSPYKDLPDEGFLAVDVPEIKIKGGEDTPEEDTPEEDTPEEDTLEEDVSERESSEEEGPDHPRASDAEMIEVLEGIKKSVGELASIVENQGFTGSPDPRHRIYESSRNAYEQHGEIEIFRNDGNVKKQFSLNRFEEFTEEKGFFYSKSTLKKVWLRTVSDDRRLTILSGPPGMGKSSLVTLLCEFFNGSEAQGSTLDRGRLSQQEKSTEANDQISWRDEYFQMVSVSPSWISPRDLVGGYSEATNSFRAKPFLEACLRAQWHHARATRDGRMPRKYFICLDEFNIAKPEKYLSSVLSLIERNYEKRQGEVICKSSRIISEDKEKSDIILNIPPNNNIYATVNIDSASKRISPKVKDRSIFVSMLPNVKRICKYANDRRPKSVDDTISSAYRIIFCGEFDDEDEIEGKNTSITKDMIEISRSTRHGVSYRTVEKISNYLSKRDIIIGENEGAEKLVKEAIKISFLPLLPGARDVGDEDYKNVLEKVAESGNIGRYLEDELKQISNGVPGTQISQVLNE